MSVNAKRFALRELTRAQHEKLDASVGELNSQDAYRRYIKGIAAFRNTVEAPIVSTVLPASFGSWRPTLIGAELKDDLRDLGLDQPGVLTGFEMPRDVSGMLGVFYVLEGSSLGARLLARQAAALGFEAGHGARHLAAQTANPESWGGFQAILEGISSFDVNTAAQSAGRTFEVALEAFSKADLRERAS